MNMKTVVHWNQVQKIMMSVEIHMHPSVLNHDQSEHIINIYIIIMSACTEFPLMYRVRLFVYLQLMHLYTVYNIII